MKEPKTDRGCYREPKGSSDSTHYQKILASPPYGLLGLLSYYQNLTIDTATQSLYTVLMKHNRFNPRSFTDWCLVAMGIIHMMLIPVGWIIHWLRQQDYTPITRRRTARIRTHRIQRPRTPRRRTISTPRIKTTKPTITRSRRWVKSLGRYQVTHYNRETGQRHTTPRVSELYPKK